MRMMTMKQVKRKMEEEDEDEEEHEGEELEEKVYNYSKLFIKEPL